jgi:hypothetical protein
MHTFFLKGDHSKVAAATLEAVPYIGALSLAELGRGREAVAGLADLEPRTSSRLREFMIAARALLEGKTADSVAAIDRLLASDFSDPEGLFYLTRHLSHLNEVDRALQVFQRVVVGGFSCYPAMAHDAWLDPLRKNSEFKKLLDTARTRHQEAARVFAAKNGPALLGIH